MALSQSFFGKTVNYYLISKLALYKNGSLDIVIPTHIIVSTNIFKYGSFRIDVLPVSSAATKAAFTPFTVAV